MVSEWDPKKAGREAGKITSPAIDKLVQSGEMPGYVGVAVLGGMIEGMLREVFVPLSRALSYEVIEKKRGYAYFVVNLRNGEQMRIEIHG